MKKMCSSKILSFIASVVDTADIRENLCEFSKKFEMVLIRYSGALGTLIHEKNLKLKISCQTPFKRMYFFRDNLKVGWFFCEPSPLRKMCWGDKGAANMRGY